MAVPEKFRKGVVETWPVAVGNGKILEAPNLSVAVE